MSQIEEKAMAQNIKVVLRCRPMTSTEASREKRAIKCVSDKHVEVNYGAMGKSAKKSFAFDGVYDEESTQEDVYESVVRPVVDEVLQGYNCTVFAYGQVLFLQALCVRAAPRPAPPRPAPPRPAPPASLRSVRAARVCAKRPSLTPRVRADGHG